MVSYLIKEQHRRSIVGRCVPILIFLILSRVVLSNSAPGLDSTHLEEREIDAIPSDSAPAPSASFLDLSNKEKAALFPFPPFLPLWADTPVAPIIESEGEHGWDHGSSAKTSSYDTSFSNNHEEKTSSSSQPDGNISSRSERSRWRMESRYADLAIASSEYPFCAWDATTDESIYTPLLLDPNAVYQPQLLSFAAHPHRVYKVISASFPRVVYFSYETYSLRGHPLTSLPDLRIDPSWGKNPYREETTEEGAGTYEIYVTRDGNKGWPNEVRGLSEDHTNATQAAFSRVMDFVDNLSVVMLRLYTTEQPPSVWGGVDRPVISYTDDLGQTWKELQPCSDTTRYQFNRAMRQIGWTVYDFRYLIYHSQWYRLRSCHLLSKREADHPALFPDVNVQVVDSGASYVPFANFDSNYLYWCTDGEQLGGNFVMVIEGTAPLTATGLFEGPRPVWNVTNYSTRYWSFAAADVFVPGPTYSSLTAQDMENFYGKGWDRRYKIVGATSIDIVKACGLDDPHALFLPYKNELMNNNPPAVPAVIEREMLARHMAMGLPSDKQSIEYVTSNCGKENKCLSIDFMKASLGDQYPSLQVYTCDVATGIKTPFVYQPYRRDYIRT